MEEFEKEQKLESFEDLLQELSNMKQEGMKFNMISDEDKLLVLKQELYRGSLDGADENYLLSIRNAIATISNQLETERHFRNSPVEMFRKVCNFVILFTLSVWLFSFPVSGICNIAGSQNRICQASRLIAGTTFKLFDDPK